MKASAVLMTGLTLALAGCAAVGPDAGERARFVDAAQAAGITYVVNQFHNPHGSMANMMDSLAGGVAVGDVDADGWMDIYIVDDQSNALYRNRGDGSFEDVTEAWGAEDWSRGRAAIFFDYDNDGWPDLLVVNYQDPLVLLHNEGGQGFTPVTVRSGLYRTTNAHGAAVADVDSDGFLDVFIANYGDYRSGMPEYYAMAENGQANLLFRNQGDGTFDEVSQEAGLTDTRWSFTGAFQDYDDDGDADLFVCNDFGFDSLYANDGDGRFVDVAAEVGIVANRNCMGISWADFNGDARVDAFVPNIFSAGSGVPSLEGNFLWLAGPMGDFHDVAATAGVQDSGWSWGPLAVDPDFDGDVDLYVANGMVTRGEFDEWDDAEFEFMPQSEYLAKEYPESLAVIPTRYNQTHVFVRTFPAPTDDSVLMSYAGHQADRFFENDGSGNFADRAEDWGLGIEEDTRAVACLDYDRDGDIDLIVTSRANPVRLFENQGPVGNHVGLLLEGVQSNRDAVGAVVLAKVGDATHRVERASGSGFQSQSTPILHLGLGDAEKLDRLTVRWPGGTIQEFDDVAAGSVYRLAEGASSLEPLT